MIEASRAELESLGTKLWGTPNQRLSSRHEIRFGSQGSKAIDVEKATWFDHETGVGGGYKDLRERATGDRPANDSIADAYDYRDADGRLSYQVIRKIPKTFRQRRPDGQGGWIWKMAGVELLPYRLPELLAASRDANVYVCEGEKDVDRLREHMVIATTNTGGALKWPPSMNHYLKGRHIVILPDNDVAGEQHAALVKGQLAGVAKSIKILRLPELSDHGDVSDWLDAGGTAEDLERLAISAKAPPTEAPAESALQNGRGKDERPDLITFTPRQCWLEPPPGYIWKTIIAPANFVCIVASPGAGKSALLATAAFSISKGEMLFELRTTETTVLYIAAEDGRGMKRRFAALNERFGDAPNCHLFPEPVDFLNESSSSIASVEALIRRLRPGLIIIDTIARAFPGFKENDPEGMGHVVKVARGFTMICGSAVWAAHHPPKDGTTTRGHGVLDGDLDATLIIQGTGTEPRAVTMGKNRNGSCDAAFAFNIVSHTFPGVDVDGDPITAPIVEPAIGGPAPAKAAKEAKLRDKPAMMLRELRALIEADGQMVCPSSEHPMLRAVTRLALRNRLIDRGWFSDDLLCDALTGGKTLQRRGYGAENNALDPLKRRAFVSFNREWVWLL